MDPFQQILTPDQLGDFARVSPLLRSSWDAVRYSHQKAAEYYSGVVFQKKVETEVGEDGAPLLYPVGINLVKMIIQSMTDATYGEFDDERSVVLWKAQTSKEVSEAEKAAIDYATVLLEDSNAASMLWELDFDRNLYGAGVLRISPDLPKRAHIKWSKVPLDGFYPVFDPTDPDIVLECWQVTQILAEQAREIYGIDTSDQTPLVKIEHWTASNYETLINGKRMDAYSGVNPWGVVPYVYIPRMRSIDWWGESLAEDIYAPQDEMNARIADAGEALSYHSHPIYYGHDLPNNFDTKNYPLDPSSFWDLGRTRGTDTPEVGMLTNDTPVAESTFKYINFLYDWTRTAASAPPIAFGEDNGGGQRSGITLEIRLWPMLKAVRRSRSYLSTGFARALQITGLMLKQKKFTDVPAGVADLLIGRRILPVFNSVLPRDEAALVDEVVKLLSTPIPAISLESAEMVLGRGQAEVDKIMKMMSLIQDWTPVRLALEALKKQDLSKPTPSSSEANGSQNSVPNG
jgi:hypothetical protein